MAISTIDLTDDDVPYTAARMNQEIALLYKEGTTTTDAARASAIAFWLERRGLGGIARAVFDHANKIVPTGKYSTTTSGGMAMMSKNPVELLSDAKHAYDQGQRNPSSRMIDNIAALRYAAQAEGAASALGDDLTASAAANIVARAAQALMGVTPSAMGRARMDFLGAGGMEFLNPNAVAGRSVTGASYRGMEFLSEDIQRQRASAMGAYRGMEFLNENPQKQRTAAMGAYRGMEFLNEDAQRQRAAAMGACSPRYDRNGRDVSYQPSFLGSWVGVSDEVWAEAARRR